MNKYKILSMIMIFLVVLNIYQFLQSSSLKKKLESNLKIELNASFSEAELLMKEFPALISEKEITRQQFDYIWHLSSKVLFGIDESITFANQYKISVVENDPKYTNRLAGEVQSFYREFLHSHFQENNERVALSEKDIQYLNVLNELFKSIGALTVPESEFMNIEETIEKVDDISYNYVEKLKEIRLF
ncbi:hypothetical protein LCL95_00780 [Bacillus timonensis]|nr:hypothetical protein [Bacillus timonensis]